MEYTEWSDKLSVNIELIDDQHKKLIVMINDIARMLINTNEREIEEILKNLKDYTVVHFSEEEKLFTNSDYPDAEKHKEEHKVFVEKLHRFEKDYRSNKVSISLDILLFLKNWLFYHIEIVDKSYAPYVTKAMNN